MRGYVGAVFVVVCVFVAACRASGASNATRPTPVPTPRTIGLDVTGGSTVQVRATCHDVAPLNTATGSREPAANLTAAATRCAAPAAGATPTPPSPTSAPRRHRIIAISAGHGGPRNIGAVHHDHAGNVDLVEKDLNLDIARRLDVLLRADGYDTVMIRDCDCSVSPDGGAQTTEQIRAESQARADIANAHHADVLVVIHHDGSDDPLISGTSVYYDPARTFGDESRKLAHAIHDALITSISGFPYADQDRGVLNDAPIGQRYGEAHTFLFGESPGFRATQMPAALGEALFVTNDTEAALLQLDTMRQRIAVGYRDGIEAYFANGP